MRTVELAKNNVTRLRQILENVFSFFRRFIVQVLSVSFVPNHVAFIMDGNRRYAKQKQLVDGVGHAVGFSAMLSMLRYCYELGVNYVAVYAFSVDNFRRSPEDVQSLMNLLAEKIKQLSKEESVVNRYGVRVRFLGNLKLLSEPVKVAAERAMAASANNKNAFLSICVAYSSTYEIVNSVEESCKENWDEIEGLDKIRAFDGEIDEMEQVIKSRDVERHLYTVGIPDPDIVIRTSGETRLTNFLLWQTAHSYLYSPSVLWPEVGLRYLLWGVLNFQRSHQCLIKKMKQV